MAVRQWNDHQIALSEAKGRGRPARGKDSGAEASRKRGKCPFQTGTRWHEKLLGGKTRSTEGMSVAGGQGPGAEPEKPEETVPQKALLRRWKLREAGDPRYIKPHTRG